MGFLSAPAAALDAVLPMPAHLLMEACNAASFSVPTTGGGEGDCAIVGSAGCDAAAADDVDTPAAFAAIRASIIFNSGFSEDRGPVPDGTEGLFIFRANAWFGAALGRGCCEASCTVFRLFRDRRNSCIDATRKGVRPAAPGP